MSQFFEKTFVLASNSFKVILYIFFLFVINKNITFIDYKFTWKSYTTTTALQIPWQVKIINKKTFAKVVLDQNIEPFVIYIAFSSPRLI